MIITKHLEVVLPFYRELIAIEPKDKEGFALLRISITNIENHEDYISVWNVDRLKWVHVYDLNAYGRDITPHLYHSKEELSERFKDRRNELIKIACEILDLDIEEKEEE